MTLLEGSLIYRICLVLAGLYRESALCRLIERIGLWCAGEIDGSRVLVPLCREGILSRSWRSSALCRILAAVLTLPGRLLHNWYSAWQATFEGSIAAQLVFAVGEKTAFAEGWIIAALWVVPYIYWDNAYSLLGFVFLLLLFHVGAMRRREMTLDPGELGFYPVALFAAILISVATSYRSDLSVRFLLYHLSAALCVLVTVSAVRCVEDLKRLAAGAGVCAAVSSLYGVVQRIQGVEVNRSYVDTKVNPDMPGRVYSYFDNPNTFAEVLVLLLPLVLALALCSKKRFSRLAAWGTLAVGIAALGMTYSRASWVGIACAVAVMAFLWRPRVIPALVVLCIAAVPLMPASILNRILTITNMNDTSTASRFPLYEAALNIIRERPLTGAGLGTDAVKRLIWDHSLYHGASPFVHAHNLYLEVWIEIGLGGVVFLLASLLWSIKNGARLARHTADSPERTITCGAVSALCGIMVCGMADVPWHYPRVMVIFWFTFAMALAGAKICRETGNTPEKI